MHALAEAPAMFALWGTGIGIVVLLLVSALFSGSETALTTASRGKLHAMADRGEAGAAEALRLTEDKERLIGAILLGNNLANILAASLATSLFTVLFGARRRARSPTLVMTALVLIFAEVMPQDLRHHQRRGVCGPGRRGRSALVVGAVSPVVSAVRAFVRLVLRLFGVDVDPKAHFLAAQQEIAGTITLHHSEGTVEKADRDRLLGALDLGQRQVEEVMMHRRDIEMIDAEAPPAEILAQAINSPHTRIPIFRGEPENIVGVIHAKDLSPRRAPLRARAPGGEGALEGFDIMDVAMQPYFVPEIDAARRADARVPAPARAFRAGGRRVRRAAGADHARGHHRGDRRRHRRRARRRDRRPASSRSPTARSRSRAR